MAILAIPSSSALAEQKRAEFLMKLDNNCTIKRRDLRKRRKMYTSKKTKKTIINAFNARFNYAALALEIAFKGINDKIM